MLVRRGVLTAGSANEVLRRALKTAGLPSQPVHGNQLPRSGYDAVVDRSAHPDLVAAVLVLIVSFGFFSQGWIGGGDAKLVAATALGFGFDNLVDYLVYASLFGGVLTIVLIQFRKLPLPAPLARQPWILRLHETGGGIPYGIALAAAALAVYPKTAWMPMFGT